MELTSSRSDIRKASIMYLIAGSRLLTKKLIPFKPARINRNILSGFCLILSAEVANPPSMRLA